MDGNYTNLAAQGKQRQDLYSIFFETAGAGKDT